MGKEEWKLKSIDILLYVYQTVIKLGMPKSAKWLWNVDGRESKITNLFNKSNHEHLFKQVFTVCQVHEKFGS